MIKAKISEKKIESLILEYLNCLPGCFAWKCNTVGVFDPVRGVYRKPKNKYLINGVSDIIGIYKGRSLFIEVKAPGKEKKLNDNQEWFLQKVSELGAIAFVASSIETVKQNLIELRMNTWE